MRSAEGVSHVLQAELHRKSYQSNSNRHHGPQDVDPAGDHAVTFEGDLQELERVKALPAALALGLNSWGDLVAIVVEARQMVGAVSRGMRWHRGLRLGLGSVFARGAAGMACHVS